MWQCCFSSWYSLIRHGAYWALWAVGDLVPLGKIVLSCQSLQILSHCMLSCTQTTWGKQLRVPIAIPIVSKSKKNGSCWHKTLAYLVRCNIHQEKLTMITLIQALYCWIICHLNKTVIYCDWCLPNRENPKCSPMEKSYCVWVISCRSLRLQCRGNQ